MKFSPKLYASLGAGALVFHDDQVLLVQMNYGAHRGKWILPGGAIEPGEHPHQAAIRETFEETGVNVKVVSLVGVRHRCREDASADVYWVFRTTPIGVPTKLIWPAEELLEAKFWPIREALASEEVRSMTRTFIQLALSPAPAPEDARPGPPDEFIHHPNPKDHEFDDSLYSVRRNHS